MVVRTATEYMNDQLANRVKSLQKALNQAESGDLFKIQKIETIIAKYAKDIGLEKN